MTNEIPVFKTELSCGHDLEEVQAKEIRPGEFSLWCPLCDSIPQLVGKLSEQVDLISLKASYHAWILQWGRTQGWEGIAGWIGKSWDSMSEADKAEFTEMNLNILRRKMERTDSPRVQKYAQVILENLVPAQEAGNEDLVDSIQDDLDDLWSEMSEAERR